MSRGFSLVCLSVVLVHTAAAQFRGASNYAWYSNVGLFWSNGIIRHYHIKGIRPLVRNQLREMYDNGQRRLRIPIYHSTFDTDCSTAKLGDGTAIRSFAGWMDPVCQDNLRHFLSDIRAQNFEEVLIGFFPAGRNDPSNWRTWNDSLFEDNWNCIRSVRLSVLVPSGLPFKIDLGNEQAPGSNQPLLIEYTRRMWRNYLHNFERGDTVGFSIVCGSAGWNACRDRLRQLPRVYGNRFPHWFSFHYIGEDQEVYDRAWEWLRASGLVQPWIIGESGYDSAVEADNLRQCLRRNGNVILWVSQWPAANPPVAFQAYANQGF